MLRVMLVDDEAMALEGLQLLIDWNKNGFTVAACCRTGAEALRRLADARPDLIVTDLFMPEIDGIALIQTAKERGFAGEFIIVSGYSDFEKARRALSLGAAGYILKPVDPDEAAGAIDRARKALLSRAMRDGQGERAAKYQPQLIDMMLGRSFDMSALPEGGEWRLTTWGSPLPMETLGQIKDALSALKTDAIPCILDEREWLILHADGSLDAAVRKLSQKVLALGRTLYAGEPLQTPAQLTASREKLEAQLNQYHAQLSRAIAELESTVTLRQEQAFISKAKALQAFCDARGRRVSAQALAMWRACCARQFEEAPDKLARFVNESVNVRDIRALGYLTIRLLSPAQQRLSDVVMAHARAGLGDSLTLDGIAAALGYNAAYLGRVFREETGVVFHTWLTALRMRRAAELLAGTQTPIRDIALAVGLQKYDSFLNNFKLAYHMTPDAYRRGAQKPGDPAGTISG